MDRFRGVGDYVSNMSRGFWLVIGLVVVAGLIAASFIYGDTNGEVASNDDNGVTISEDAEENGEATEASEEEAEENRDATDAASVNGEELPAELADTGAALPIAGMVLLGAGGYFYRHSKKQLAEANLDS